MSETEYDFRDGKRGAVVPAPAGQTQITIGVDPETLEWFRAQVHAAGGGDYRLLMSRALRAYAQEHGEPLEDVLRRVLREELHPA